MNKIAGLTGMATVLGGLLAFSGLANASTFLKFPFPTVPSSGCPAIPAASVQFDYVGPLKNSDVVVKLSGLVGGSSRYYVQFYKYAGIFPTLIPIGPREAVTGSTQTFTVSPGTTPTPLLDLAVAEFYETETETPPGPSTQCLYATETSPVLWSSLPYGQLPEVPYSAGIPLVGIGVAATLWVSKRRSAT